MEVMRPFSPQTPSRKQSLYLEQDCLELFYGGAAGGGKSSAALLGALQYVDVPGYAAIIFRRTKPELDLPDSIKARADAWFAGLEPRVTWDGSLYGYRFKTRAGQPDATISFGYLLTDKDKYRYQGAAFQYIFVDELVQWIESPYLYLFSRLRKPKGMRQPNGLPVPLRMRSAGNPGGVGHAWVKERFIDFGRTEAGLDVPTFIKMRRTGKELPWPPIFKSPPSKQAIRVAKILNKEPESSLFLPAFMEDNPGVDAGYKASIANLDETDRARLEDGDWDAIHGGKFFKPEYFKYIPKAPPELSEIRYWDLAGTKDEPGKDPDWSAGVRMGVHRLETGARRIYITDVTRVQEDPGGVELHVRGTAQADGYAVGVWIEEEPGSAGKNNTHHYGSQVLFGWNVNGHRKTGPKTEFWKSLSSAGRHGLLYLVTAPWNREFVAELCGLTGNDSHAHDDMADAAAGGFAMLTQEEGLDWLAMMTANVD